MAESVKLQPLGLQFKVPQTDFVGSRVQAQAFSEMSSSLDRMSNYLFKIAEQRAKIEGAEYGAENAPTKQQIEDAYNAGEEIPIAGDKFTVYGQSVRAAQLEMVSDELQYIAKSKITELTTSYNSLVTQYGKLDEKGKQALSPTNYVNELNEIVAGYAATLDETSPGFAKKFRAKLSMENNARYLSYADKFMGEHNKVYKAQVIANGEIDINNIAIDIESYFKNGSNATEQLKITTLDNMSKLSSVGVDTVGFNNRMTEAVRLAAKNTVVNELLAFSKPSEIIRTMYDGEFNQLPGNIGKAMKLAEDYGVNRKDFVKQVQSQIDESKKLLKEKKDLEIKKNEEKINFSISDAISFLAVGDEDSANDIMAPYQTQQLKGTSEELKEWEKISKAYKDNLRNNFKDDANTIIKLRRKLFSTDNPLTLEELTDEFANQKIGQATFFSMSNQINSLSNEQMNEARRYILDETGHNPEIRIDDPDGDQALKERVFREIMGDVFEAEIQAKLDGKPFSAILKAKELYTTKGVELLANRIKANRKNAISTIQEIATIIESTDAQLSEKFKNVTDDNLNSLVAEAIGTAEEIIANHKTKYKNFSKTIIDGYPIVLGRELQ